MGSEVKRYNDFQEQDDWGAWVPNRDYSALAAENARLTAQLAERTRERDIWKAEGERTRTFLHVSETGSCSINEDEHRQGRREIARLRAATAALSPTPQEPKHE